MISYQGKPLHRTVRPDAYVLLVSKSESLGTCPKTVVFGHLAIITTDQSLGCVEKPVRNYLGFATFLSRLRESSNCREKSEVRRRA